MRLSANINKHRERGINMIHSDLNKENNIQPIAQTPEDVINNIKATVTEMELQKFVVLICGPNTKKKYENQIRETVKKHFGSRSGLRIIIKDNVYIPDDGKFISVEDAWMKYNILSELGIVKKNDTFEASQLNKRIRDLGEQLFVKK